MHRFRAALAAWAAAGLVMAVASPLHAQQKFTLKGQSTHPASANLHLIFKLLAKTVEKMSAGRLKVGTQPGGATVPPFEVFDAASKGVLDVGMTPFGYIAGPTRRRSPCRTGRSSAWTAWITTRGITTATV